ncbi:hypothetical protein [Kitasatospora albolonga]|uniref:hypothetical protein n=1 Tax=Kitasatospora albolonga TaxID=68173 RepID=UPI0035ECE9A3
MLGRTIDVPADAWSFATACEPARDDLLDTLRRGAEVGLWVGGGSDSLARHYAGLDELTDGAAAATVIGPARAGRAVGALMVGDFPVPVSGESDGDVPLPGRAQ